MSISPALVKKITRELTCLHKSPPDGVRIIINQDDITDVVGWIHGDDNTPYQGGYFKIKFDFVGVDYPNVPPKCTMITKIFHPNVSDSGEICVDTLKKSWQSSYGIGHILTTVKCLLIAPNPDSALNPEAGSLLQENYQSYYSTSQLWTSIYASAIPSVFSTSTLEESNSNSPKSTAIPAQPISELSSSSASPIKSRTASSKAKSASNSTSTSNSISSTKAKEDQDGDVEMMDVNGTSSQCLTSTLPLGQSTSSNSTKIVGDVKDRSSKNKTASASSSNNNATSSGNAGGNPNPNQIVGVKRSAGGNGNKNGVKRGVKRL